MDDELRPPRKLYPSDVSDEAWAFVAPYLTVMRSDAPQRKHALRRIVRAGAPWRYLPTIFPPLGSRLPANLQRN